VIQPEIGQRSARGDLGQAAEGSRSSPVATLIARPLDAARWPILHGSIALIDVKWRSEDAGSADNA
jgi:hypothetical protein